MKSYLEELDPTQSAPTAPMAEGAGFLIRALARLIDLASTFLLSFAAGIIAVIGAAILVEAGRVEGDWDALVNRLEPGMGIAILAAFVSQTVMEGIGGTSLGKPICGLRVVQTDGRSCSFFAAFKRSLLYHADALFFGLVGYNSMKDSPLRQRYGDVWAKTVVVKRRDFAPTPAIAAWKIVISLILAWALWVTIVSTSMVFSIL